VKNYEGEGRYLMFKVERDNLSSRESTTRCWHQGTRKVEVGHQPEKGDPVGMSRKKNE